MKYTAPGQAESLVAVESRYENFIGGKWLPPVAGNTGSTCARRRPGRSARWPSRRPRTSSTRWTPRTPPPRTVGGGLAAERAAVLNAVADAIDAHREMLAVTESWENGKPVRETLAADIPLAADHFRYFAAAIRAMESHDHRDRRKDTIAYHFHEPLGVVGQIIPFNFPLLMAAWKLAPALAAGNCTVIKPASPDPVVDPQVGRGHRGHRCRRACSTSSTGPGREIGKALATSPRIAKVAFTGETVTGRLIMQYAAQNIIPVTLELGGKSPNIFFADVLAERRRVPRQGDRGPGALRVQ